MQPDELKQVLSALLPEASFETGEFPAAVVPPGQFLPFMKEIRHDRRLHFDYLFCLTCVDWKDHFMMVYHLLSKTHRHSLVVKVKIDDRENPVVDSVSGIWKTADFHEREVYDMFGVKFNGHPDLRRLFLDEDWKGFPLRKDYEDPHMIEL